jgi:hypothetical protein
MRGRSQRGHGSQSGSGFHQRKYFQSVPQYERKASCNQKPTRNWYVDLLTNVKSLISAQPGFRGGNTKNCVSKWTEITSDPEILDYIEHCHIEFIDDPSKYSIPGHQHFNVHQHDIISKEVDKLLQLGVISNSMHAAGECISPIFVVPINLMVHID